MYDDCQERDRRVEKNEWRERRRHGAGKRSQVIHWIVRREESVVTRWTRQPNFCSFSGIHLQPVCGRKTETAISLSRERRYRRSGAFGIFILRYAQPIRPVAAGLLCPNNKREDLQCRSRHYCANDIRRALLRALKSLRAALLPSVTVKGDDLLIAVHLTTIVSKLLDYFAMILNV